MDKPLKLFILALWLTYNLRVWRCSTYTATLLFRKQTSVPFAVHEDVHIPWYKKGSSYEHKCHSCPERVRFYYLLFLFVNVQEVTLQTSWSRADTKQFTARPNTAMKPQKCPQLVGLQPTIIKLVAKEHTVILRFKRLIRSSTTTRTEKSSVQYYFTIISHVVILVSSKGYKFPLDIQSWPEHCAGKTK